MNPILALLLGQLSERLLVVLLLQILEQVKPVVVGTTTQLDDIALEALIVALRREGRNADSRRRLAVQHGRDRLDDAVFRPAGDVLGAVAAVRHGAAAGAALGHVPARAGHGRTVYLSVCLRAARAGGAAGAEREGGGEGTRAEMMKDGVVLYEEIR